MAEATLERLASSAARASYGRVVVAFSGGADSAFLAFVANEVLRAATRCVAVTAVSPSLAADERDDCASLAAEWGLHWRPRSRPTRWTTRPTGATTATGASGARTRSWTRSSPSPRPRRAHGRARGQPRRPRRPPARPAGGGAAGGRFPAGRRRLHQGRRARRRRAAWACARGTSPRPPAWRRGSRTAPRSPSAVLGRGRAGRGGRSTQLGFARAAGAPLRRRRSDRGAGRPARIGAAAPRRRRRRRAGRPATSYVTLDLEGLRSGNLNQAL